MTAAVSIRSRAPRTLRAPPTGSQASPVWLAYVVLGCLLGAALGASRRTPHGYMLSLNCLYLATGLYVIGRERRRFGPRGLVSPASLLTIVWGSFFGPVAWAGLNSAYTDARLGNSPTSVVGACAVAFVGLSITLVTYGLSTRRTAFESVAQNTRLHVNWAVVAVLLCVSWAARVARFQTGSFGYLSYGSESSSGALATALSLLTYLLSLTLAVLALVAFSSRSAPNDRRRAKITLIANLLPLALTAIGSGVSGRLATDLLPAAIVYIVCTGRVPWRTLLAMVVYLSMVYGGIEQYRADIAAGTVQRSERSGIFVATGAALKHVGEDVFSGSPIGKTVSLFDNATREYRVISTSLAAILDRTPERVQHLGNKRLFADAAFFVPRSLTAAHPTEVGAYVNEVYLDGPTRSAVPPTIPGDLYMSGGWATFVVGQAVFGVLLALVWMRTGATASGGLIAVYALLISTAIYSGGDFGTVIRASAQFLIAFPPLVRFAVQSSRSNG